MNIRKAALGAALASALSVPTLASAITVAGIHFQDGAIFETIDLFEAEAFGDGIGDDNGKIDQLGEKLVGIGQVNRIRANDIANGNPILWQSGDNGMELTIYFYDYVAENFDPSGGADVKIGFTGGKVEIWAGAAGNFAPTTTQAGGIATATDGVLWLSLQGSPIGLEALGSSEYGSVSNTPITLRSVGPLASGSVGGLGNLDVTGGLAAGHFDTNTFNCTPGLPGSPCPNSADKVFTSSGQLGANPSAAGWAFFGTGEVQDFAIPEPGSLALLGVSMAGLGFGARRKANKA